MSPPPAPWSQIAVVAVLVAFPTAWAQGPTLLTGLFPPDLAELKPNDALKDAVKRAKRECYPPRIKLTVFGLGDGDPLFVHTLG